MPTSASHAVHKPATSGRLLLWVRFASLAIILVCVVLLVRLLPVDRLTAMLSTKVGQLGVWGPVAFGAVYIVAAVLFVPGAALTLAAGAVFGLVMGTIVVSIASTTAAAASFLIGRYVARDAVHHWAMKDPRFAAIDRAIGQGGWKIIALLRLSPAVPFSLGNYLFGITAIRFWPYVLTSWLAMLPGTFMYVYLGYAGRAGLAAASGGGHSRSPAQWALLAVGLAATVAVTIYVTHIARKAIKENQVMSGKAEPSDNSAASAKAPASRMLVTLLLAAFSLALLIVTGCALFNRDKITGLFGPPAVKLHETYAVKPGGPTFDHSIFNQVLHKYVSQEGGWVDYDGLAKDHAGLDEYVASLAKAPFDQMGRDQKLALLLNAYNAFTLRLILDHYPLKSIKDIPSDQRWEARRWNIGGHVWSLNQIEHEQIRPKFKEPRVHFALVCAAIGCPPLRDEAYVADRLEQQLQSQTIYVHSHGRWFQFDPTAGIVKLTSLYKWYAGDFEQVAGSILQFAARYSPPLKEAMDSGRTPRIEFLDYNWSLNSRENRP